MASPTISRKGLNPETFVKVFLQLFSIINAALPAKGCFLIVWLANLHHQSY
jgi:hypothetical protein